MNSLVKFALLARKGSGRTFFQNLLKDEGLKIAKSYTTREQRDSNDRYHHFLKIDNIDVDKIIKDNGLDVEQCFATTHENYTYFYDKKELIESDVIPIDPENLENLCKMFPDTIFHVIEIVADNKDRLVHAVANAEDKLTAEEDFIADCEEENKAFCDFEDAIAAKSLNIDNISGVSVIQNNFDYKSDIYRYTVTIRNTIRLYNRVGAIITYITENDPELAEMINKQDDKYTIRVKTDDDKTEDKLVSLAELTKIFIEDDHCLGTLMGEWLCCKNNPIDSILKA